LLQDSADAERIGKLAQAAAEKLAGALPATMEIAEQLLAHARA
jgi:hypothetical protein